jgi:carboxypeptidase T
VVWQGHWREQDSRARARARADFFPYLAYCKLLIRMKSLKIKVLKAAWLVLATFSGLPGFSQENYSRVKLFATDAELHEIGELGVTIDHGKHKHDTWFITDLSASEIQLLQDNGYNYEVLIQDVQAHYIAQNLEPAVQHKTVTCPDAGGANSFQVVDPVNWQLGSMAGFYTYQEFLDELDSMASKYPNLITVKSPISTFTTHDGNPVYWVRLSDNPNSDEGEEEVLYTSLHHAREPASLSQLIFYMWWILENYGTNEEVTYLVDETEMYFVPMINPDGYIYNETLFPGGGGMHRKNRRNVGTTNKGVDLNRNYSYHWNESGTSPNPNNDTYAGTAAFTEPETQAIKWFCENRDFTFAFNAHTHGNLLLFPMGWDYFDFAPDHDYMQAFSNHMVIFNGYSAVKSSDLYPAAGDSDDWMYADDLGTKPKIYALTPECSSEGTSNDFWPPQSSIHDICAINIWMNKTLAHMPHIYGVVTDLDQEQVENTSGYFHYEIERLGLEDGDIMVSMTALTGIQTLGAINTHTLNLMDIEQDSIDFTLVPGIAFGDEIKYVLHTDNGTWVKHDTITKTFGLGTEVFSDDCSDLTNWTGTWSFTNEDFVSPANCITDSPFSEYNNSEVSDLELNQTFSLANATYGYIKFDAKWALENDYDYVQLMISTDGGSVWTPLCGKYTNAGSSDQDFENPLWDGFQTDWVHEEIDLTDYLDMADVKFKFHLVSDVGVTEDGFYFDDFAFYTDAFDDSGVDEVYASLVTVYPNPSQQYITIQLKNLEAIQTIEIYNQLGEIIAVLNPTAASIQYPVFQLATGNYLVKVVDAEGVVSTGSFSVTR